MYVGPDISLVPEQLTQIEGILLHDYSGFRSKFSSPSKRLIIDRKMHGAIGEIYLASAWAQTREDPLLRGALLFPGLCHFMEFKLVSSGYDRVLKRC